MGMANDTKALKRSRTHAVPPVGDSEAAPLLSKLDAAANMLAETVTPADIKQIIDVAEAARVYARGAKLGLEVQNRAAALKLMAAVKAGDAFAKLQKGKGGRPSRLDDVSVTPAGRPGVSDYWNALHDTDVPMRTAEDWQQLARGRAQVEEYIDKTRAAGDEITTAGALRAVHDDFELAPTVRPTESSRTRMPTAKHSARASRLASGDDRRRPQRHKSPTTREMVHDFLDEAFSGDTTLAQALQQARQRFVDQASLPGNDDLEMLIARFALVQLRTTVPDFVEAVCSIDIGKRRLGDVHRQDVDPKEPGESK